MCMIDSAEHWDFWRVLHRKARKQHRCVDCSRTIEKGEPLIYCSGMYDGVFSDMYQCQHCNEAARWLQEVCGGFLYGAVLEDLEEHMHEIIHKRRLSLGRLVIGMRKGWMKDRVLMPLPVIGITQDVLDWPNLLR